MSTIQLPKNNPFPQMPCALTEFVPTLLPKSVRLNLKLDLAPPSEFPDP
jgi:hypothetical protein